MNGLRARRGVGGNVARYVNFVQPLLQQVIGDTIDRRRGKREG